MQMPNDSFLVEELICNESFQHYCLGTDLQNQLLWQNWIEQLPHKKAEFEEAKRLVELLTVKQGSRLQQIQALKSGLKQKQLFSEALLGVRTEPLPLKIEKTGPSIYKYLGGIAALLVLSLFVYLLSPSLSNFFLLKEKSETTVFSGQQLRKTIVLKDGTVITLAKESSVKLRANFESNREIWLSGEAFFDVTHDTLHPFIVHTTFNDIKVLGTAFNVRAYPDAKEMETTLLRGSIRVDSKKYPGVYAILKPNERLLFKNDSIVKKGATGQPFDVATVTLNAETKKPEAVQWVQNRLEIDDEPLSVIAKKLESWYGMKIVITDEAVKSYHYSGVFENESILKTLEALQLSYPFQFTVSEHQITITR
ncbi:FecR family protein [Pedobacter sp.]|uniref:FecR family protein n=1 Tax=Pedobacter sp. TaxID=1411316 RepID=UPI003D7F620F